MQRPKVLHLLKKVSAAGLQLISRKQFSCDTSARPYGMAARGDLLFWQAAHTLSYSRNEVGRGAVDIMSRSLWRPAAYPHHSSTPEKLLSSLADRITKVPRFLTVQGISQVLSKCLHVWLVWSRKLTTSELGENIFCTGDSQNCPEELRYQKQ